LVLRENGQPAGHFCRYMMRQGTNGHKTRKMWHEFPKKHKIDIEICFNEAKYPAQARGIRVIS